MNSCESMLRLLHIRLLTGCALLWVSLLTVGCGGQPGTAAGGGSGGGPGGGGGGPGGGPGGKPPDVLSVMWTKPVRAQITEYEEFTGRTWAIETVELRSRVSGYLEKIHFEDAALVSAGELLFEIDKRPFEGEADRSRAAVAQIEARVKRLTSQMKRARELEARGAISIDNLETTQFDLEEAEAALNEARAQLSLAELNVEYAAIRAPTSGRIGRRLVDRGNLVIEDQTALATIVPQEEIHVYFDIDERTVLRLRREESKQSAESTSNQPPTSEEADEEIGEEVDEAVRGQESLEVALTAADASTSAATVPTWKSRKVEIALADSESFDLVGEIDFMDNQVDPATGTLRARAKLNNQSGLLTPGLFVRVRYPLSEQESVLEIPEESIGSVQGRRVVYVVRETDKGTVAVQLSEKSATSDGGPTSGGDKSASLEFGPLNGGMRAVRSGLSENDQVITTGLHRLKQGMTIKLLDPNKPSEPSAR